MFLPMLQTVSSAVLPLFLMVLAGSYAYRKKKLPENSATVLNGFVYYFTLPALLFCSLATTPFNEIMQLDFIGGYTLAMLCTYALTLLISMFLFRSHYTTSSVRATTASFCNSAYLGIPIMMFLFGGSKQAMLATTLAIILPTTVIILIVGTLELHKADKNTSTLQTLKRIIPSVLKTPVIGSSFAGGIYSFTGLGMPDFLVTALKSFGMASIPCALFAIGILIMKLKMEFRFSQMLTINIAKLIIHPILAAIFMLLFGVRDQMLLMGIILSGLPPATLVSVIAETYSTCEAETAATLLSATLLYMPALYGTLVVASSFGLTLG